MNWCVIAQSSKKNFILIFLFQEKTNLSFGRDKHGIESPIPDFDILRDEKVP